MRDLIRYENEHSALDFKAKQYRKEVHEDLLTDVLAMANADVLGDRHIVVGVNHRPDGTREFIGVKADEFVDPAIYQNLVRANIEPDLDLDYFCLDVEGTKLGVIRISGCEHQPYMMRKDFGRLRAGDAFVRKGSHQARLTRPDLERMIARRSGAGPEEGELTISLSPSEVVTDLALPALGKVELPSDQAADKIRAILREREEQRRNLSLSAFGPAVLASITMPSILGGTPYHLRPDDELRKDLDHVKETYRDDDLYELFEQHASKLNVYIRNSGTQYVDDATVELRILPCPGLSIADRIHRQPDNTPFGQLGSIYALTGLMARYPHVVSDADHIIVRNQLGAIKHHRTTPAFAEPLRVVVSSELVGQTLSLELVILAKNLPAPCRRQLHIMVVNQAPPMG